MTVLQTPRAPSRSDRAARAAPRARRISSPRATLAALLLALGAAAAFLSVTTYFSHPTGLERHWLAAAAITLFAAGLRASGSSGPHLATTR